MTKRYTAVLKIVEVEETPSSSSPRRHESGQTAKTDSEILSITVRNTSLEGLKTQLAAHVALAEG